MTKSDSKPETTPEATAAKPEVAGNEKGNGLSSKVWMGTAVGVGSAALVAALMYANRRNKKA